VFPPRWTLKSSKGRQYRGVSSPLGHRLLISRRWHFLCLALSCGTVQLILGKMRDQLKLPFYLWTRETGPCKSSSTSVLTQQNVKPCDYQALSLRISSKWTGTHIVGAQLLG
jgi:hypothetical protein